MFVCKRWVITIIRRTIGNNIKQNPYWIQRISRKLLRVRASNALDLKYSWSFYIFVWEYLGQGNHVVLLILSCSKRFVLKCFPSTRKLKAGVFEKSVFEKLRFRDGLPWAVGLAVEIKLCALLNSSGVVWTLIKRFLFRSNHLVLVGFILYWATERICFDLFLVLTVSVCPYGALVWHWFLFRKEREKIILKCFSKPRRDRIYCDHYLILK